MLRWTKLGGGNKDVGQLAVAAQPGQPPVGADGLTDQERQALEDMDRFYGMENFGNTCYANSVLQSLYFCRPFRDCINTYPTLLTPFVPTHNPPTFSPLPASATLATANEKAANQAALSSSNHSYSTAKSSQPPAASAAPAPPAVSPASEKKPSRWPGTKRVLATTSAATPSLTLTVPNTTLSGPTSPVPSSSPTAPQDPTNTQLIIPHSPVPPATLFIALQTLFRHIASIPPPVYAIPPKDKDGNVGPPAPLVTTVVAPAAFVGKLKAENEMFRGTMQQDAHEFLNYLLNKIGEDLEADEKERRNDASKKRSENGGANIDDLSASLASLSTAQTPGGSSSSRKPGPEPTFVQKLFEGKLTNETRCLTCETTSSRDESFLDLSIDIEQNTSITACLRQFSASETLCQRNKFYCDTCCGLQEAEKRMKIKTLPNVLALHLKRFKYQEELGRYVKLNYRVTFPFQLRLFNTSDDSEDPDRLYELFAIVVHVGGGPHHGHYIAIAKTGSGWMMFDDDTVSPIDEADIQKYYGESAAGSGYVLFYQAVDMDPTSVGLHPRDPEPAAASTLTPAMADFKIGQPPSSAASPYFLPPSSSPSSSLAPLDSYDDSRTPVPSPPARAPILLDLGSPAPTITPPAFPSPVREFNPPPPPPPLVPAPTAAPPRSPREQESASPPPARPPPQRVPSAPSAPSELSRSLAANRTPAAPSAPAPPSASSMSRSETNSTLNRASSMASLPAPLSSSSVKDRDSNGGGNWFTRRNASNSKEKAERRISSSSSWYGSLSSSTHTNGNGDGGGRERSHTMSSTASGDDAASSGGRSRLPSSSGGRTRDVSGPIPEVDDTTTTGTTSTSTAQTSSSGSGSNSTSSFGGVIPPTHATHATNGGGGYNAPYPPPPSPPLPLPPAARNGGGGKDDKKSEKKSSNGLGGRLGGALGRSGSMALKLGSFGRKGGGDKGE